MHLRADEAALLGQAVTRIARAISVVVDPEAITPSAERKLVAERLRAAWDRNPVPGTWTRLE